MHKVYIVEDDPATAYSLEAMVSRLGHKVVGTAQTAAEALLGIKKVNPDLLITDIRMPCMDGLELAERVNQVHPLPVIVVTVYDDEEFLQRLESSPVMAYLIKPVEQVDLKVAIASSLARFRQFQRVSQEAADLRQALEDRKTIERAKGALMKRMDLDEAEAFRKLRGLASNTNRKLVEVASQIIASEQVFLELERTG